MTRTTKQQLEDMLDKLTTSPVNQLPQELRDERRQLIAETEAMLEAWGEDTELDKPTYIQ